MSDVDLGRAVFVFDPDATYGMVDDIRKAGVMPTQGLRYVASVSGRWKIFKVMAFQGLADVPQRLDGPGDPETAISLAAAKVRRSIYREHTALVRIETEVPDPSQLVAEIGVAVGTEVGEPVEVDVVAGTFDLLACVIDDIEDRIGDKVLNIRRIKGVKRTTSLRVFDYVSTSSKAPAGHQVRAAGG